VRSLGTIRDLAGGRVPPLTRTALLAGLAVFLAALVLVRPTDGGLPRAEPLRGGVRWVSADHAPTEGVLLLDPSVAYLPGRLINPVDLPSAGPRPSEETPFKRLDRRLAHDPLVSSAPPLSLTNPTSPSAATASPLASAEPFTTFGRANLAQSGMSPRSGVFEVYQLSGAKKPEISGILPHLDSFKSINSKKEGFNAPPWDKYEAIVGVDSLGQTGLPAVIHSSGDSGVDQALARWAAGVPWARYLAPGTYRLIVCP
jgi:hypothetical protein